MASGFTAVTHALSDISPHRPKSATGFWFPFDTAFSALPRHNHKLPAQCFMTDDVTLDDPLSFPSKGIPLELHRLSLPSFRSFQPHPWVLFTFPSRYLYAIGLGTYLRLGVGTPIFMLVSPNVTLDTAYPLHQIFLRGYHPLSQAFPDLLKNPQECKAVQTPHLHYIAAMDLVCLVPLSFATTYSIEFLSFPALTKMFQFSASTPELSLG